MKRRWMVITAIAVFGVVCGELPAQVAATPAQPTTAEKKSYAALSPDKRLAFEGGLLRIQGAVSFDRVLTLLPADAADALRKGLDYRGDAADRYWSSLLRSAVQYQKVDGTVAETLWWSPVVDAGIAISWNEVGSDWRIVAAAPVLGETLRGEAKSFHGGPAWSAKGDPQAHAAALQQTAAATSKAVLAGALHPLFDHPAASINVLARSAVMDDNLTLRLGAPNRWRNVAARLLFTLSPAQVKEPGNVALGHLLASFSDQQRLMFAPRLVVANGPSQTVLWVSAAAPHRVLLVRYPDAKSIMPSEITEVSLAPATGGAQ
jgi:hypothetical protein